LRVLSFPDPLFSFFSFSFCRLLSPRAEEFSRTARFICVYTCVKKRGSSPGGAEGSAPMAWRRNIRELAMCFLHRDITRHLTFRASASREVPSSERSGVALGVLVAPARRSFACFRLSDASSLRLSDDTLDLCAAVFAADTGCCRLRAFFGFFSAFLGLSPCWNIAPQRTP